MWRSNHISNSENQTLLKISHYFSCQLNQAEFKNICIVSLPLTSWETLYLNWHHELWVNTSADDVEAADPESVEKVDTGSKNTVCVWSLRYNSEKEHSFWHKLDQFKVSDYLNCCDLCVTAAPTCKLIRKWNHWAKLPNHHPSMCLFILPRTMCLYHTVPSVLPSNFHSPLTACTVVYRTSPWQILHCFFC